MKWGGNMKKAIHVAKANILKNKSATLSFAVIIILVSTLVTLGVSVLTGVEKDFYDGIDRLNSLHNVMLISRNQYNPAYDDIIRNDPRVAQYEIKQPLFNWLEKTYYGGESDLTILIFNIDEPMEISGVKEILEEDTGIPRDNAVYLPTLAKTFGFKTGDNFKFFVKNREYNLTVAGFFDTNEFANLNTMVIKFFVSDECYKILSGQISSAVWITARFHDFNDGEKFNKDFADAIGIEETDLIAGFTSATSKSVISNSSMVAAIIVVFALLISVISMFVIRFRVTSSIEDTMHEIGVLKATGYTNRQIISSYIMEYGIIAFPASVFGIFLSIPFFPAARNIMTQMSGFSWTLSVNITVGLISALALTFIMLLMVYGSCNKIKKMPPVQALRGGIAANSFRKNFFPLKKGSGSVHIKLAFKNMLAFVKSYAMVGLVISGIAIACTFIAIIYQAFVIDLNGFMQTIGMETYNINITATRHTDANALAAEIAQMPEVKKTVMLDVQLVNALSIEDIPVGCNISDDFSVFKNLKAVRGRMPECDNEIALPMNLAARINKKIDDKAVITLNGIKREYIITGFFPSIINSGELTAMTFDGMRVLNPNYERTNISIYLNNNEDNEKFIEKLKQQYGVLNVHKQEENEKFAAAKLRAEEKIAFYLERYDVDSVEYAVILNDEIIISGSSSAYQIEKITDWQEFIDTAVSPFANMVAMLTQIIAVVSLIIISLILFMVMKVIVHKRRRELGIMKSSGYTSKQLIRQLSISFMPVAVIASAAGSAAGALLVNPLMSMVLSMAGAGGAKFEVNIPATVIVGLFIVLFTYIAANLAARRIKKISVYELISE